MYLPALAPGQSSESELVRKLIEKIERLEKRVTELESAKDGAKSTVPPPVAAQIAPAAGSGMAGMMHPSPQLADEAAGFSHPVLNIAGFSDLNFAASDQKETRSGFSEGQFILHLTSRLSQKVSFFGELSFSARSDAGRGSPAATGFNIEVERSIIRYDYNDHLKVSFGRYHTPINYWNTAFHHGSWLQTTASRPAMAQFGGSFLPVHFVGALTEGSVPAGGLNLNYSAGVGNGRGETISRGGDFGDINNNRAWLASVFSRPDKLLGFQVGGSIYRDRIDESGLAPISEWIKTFHIVREKENPEIIAEFANVTHRPYRGGVVSNSQAFYVQVAHRLNWFDRKWKPYYRYEYMHIPRSDTAFRVALLNSFNGSTVGVRYDISSFSALKFEYRSMDRPGLPRINAGFAQTSFTF
jgi:hypothetical protein